VRIDSTTAFSAFQGDDLKSDNPLYELFQANYSSDGGRLELNTNFSILDNESRGTRSFDLYALDGAVWAIPESLKVSFGRSFHTHMTVRPHLLDSVSVESFLLNKSLRMGGYLGIERSPEDLNGEKSKTLGLSFGYVTPSVFPLTTGVRVEHQDFKTEFRDLMKLSFHKPFEMPLDPELMLDFERDLKFNQWNRSEIGLDFYPNMKTTAGVRYHVYELDPLVGGEDPILNILSQGRVTEIGAKAGYLLSRDIYGSYYYAKTDFLLQSDVRAYGERHQLSLNANFEILKPNLSLYKITSYGGWVEGARGGVVVKLNSKYELFTMSDYTQYEKITSSKRTAISNQFGLSNFSFSQFRLDIQGEINSNNSNYEDYRFLIKLSTLYWKET
jgi:hypothetical protein